MNKPSNFLLSIFIICFSLLYITNTCAAVNFPTFEPIGFDEANPALEGAERGQQFVQNNMMFAEELRTRQLQNQMLEQKLAQVQAENHIKMMILSQNKYPTYLGCYNCPIFMENSVHNDGNSYGSKYGKNSIYNSHSAYGSSHSNISACNSHATNPPVIVDNHGNFYGLLTLNTQLPGAIKEPIVLKWLKEQVCKK